MGDALWHFGRSIITGRRNEKSRFGGVILGRFFQKADRLIDALGGKKS